MPYTTKAIAELLGWSTDRVRRFVRNGLVKPAQSHGRYQFEFSDLVLFRTAHQLESQSVSPRKLLQTLRVLRRQMPDGKALSTVKLAARGQHVLVSQGALTWEPHSGQIELQLEADAQSKVGKLPVAPPNDGNEQYNRAIDLEADDPGAAMEAYRAVLKAAPAHYDALINLGRLQQENGDYKAAQASYTAALKINPNNPLTNFNLGTLAEAQGEIEAAIQYYEGAADELSDAHFNLAHLYEARGEMQPAIRHLREYQRMQHAWQKVEPIDEQPD